VYAAISLAGIALSYRNVSAILSDGGPDGFFGWLTLSAWSAAVMYLSIYTFMLASALVFEKRRGVVWDVAALIVFATALFASLVTPPAWR
jgi:hypothetical protein